MEWLRTWGRSVLQHWILSVIWAKKNWLLFRRRQRGSVLIPAHLCDDPTFQLRAFARLIQHRLPGPIAIPATFLTFVYNPQEPLLLGV